MLKTVRVSLRETASRYLSIFDLTHDPVIAVWSTAVYEPDIKKLCVLALNPTGNPGFVMRGDGNLTGTSCAAWSNANTSKSLRIEKTINVSLGKMCGVGTVFNASHGVVTPEPKGDCEAQLDPLDSFSLPVPAGCDHNNFSSNDPVVYLNPGTYCNGITIVSDKVIAAPGILLHQGRRRGDFRNLRGEILRMRRFI